MTPDGSVVALLEKGMSVTETARRLGTNRNQVYRVRRRNIVNVIGSSDELREALHKLDVAYLRFEASASVESYGKLIEARERYEAARRS